MTTVSINSAMSKLALAGAFAGPWLADIISNRLRGVVMGYGSLNC